MLFCGVVSNLCFMGFLVFGVAQLIACGEIVRKDQRYIFSVDKYWIQLNELNMDSSWRASLAHDSRQKIVKRM